MAQESPFVGRGKPSNTRSSKQPSVEARQEAFIRVQAATNAKTINASEVAMKQVLRQLNRWITRGHITTSNDRKILFAKLPYEFWNIDFNEQLVGKKALNTYHEVTKLRDQLEQHEASKAFTLVQAVRRNVQEALQRFNELINGYTTITHNDVLVIKHLFPIDNWTTAKRWRDLPIKDFEYYTDVLDKMMSFSALAQQHNVVVIKRKTFIGRLRKGGKGNFLYCLVCSDIVWPNEVLRSGLTLENFDRLSICVTCRNPLLFLQDAAEIGERYVCPECNKIELKTVQKFDSESAWYCNDCYTALPLDTDYKAITNRSWDSFFGKKKTRIVPSDETVENWASSVTDLFNQSSCAQKERKRFYLEQQASKMRLDHAQSNLNVSKTESRFFTHVLQDRAATERNGWIWEHQKVLLDQYIADFYCEMPRVGAPPLKFVIELDGRDHNKDPKLFTDQIRDVHLRVAEYLTLRIWNKCADLPYKEDFVDGSELNALIGIVEEWFQTNVDR